MCHALHVLCQGAAGSLLHLHPSGSYVEILAPNMVMSGDGPWEVLRSWRVEPPWMGLESSWENPPTTKMPQLSHHVRTWQEVTWMTALTWQSWHPDLRLPALRVINPVVYKPPSLWCLVRADRMDCDRPRPGCDGPGRRGLWVRMRPPEKTGVLKEGRQTRAASPRSESPKWASYQNQTSSGLCILQDCVSAPSPLLLCLKRLPHRPTISSPRIYLCCECLLHPHVVC